MTNESLSEWEQEHIHVLTSRQMGAWLGRRENRLLDEIKAEIENDWKQKNYTINLFSCELGRVMEIIDKYKVESEEEE